MKTIHLIVVGKIKDKNIEALEENYAKRFKDPKLLIHEVKSHSENLNLEAKEVLSRISDLEKDGKSFVVLMAENGKEYDSPSFSKWVFNHLESRQEKMIFVIGGAAGHGEQVKERSDSSLSLSLMTFPHKLARLLFVEQMYRAVTIFNKHPYHK